MSRRASLMSSAVGQKAAMAVSGFLLFGFVVLHMLGNLKAFQGAESFNQYAEFIREFGYPLLPHAGFLWVQRVGLLALVLLHVGLAIKLARASRAARPVGYRKRADLGFSYASRTMRWGGLIIALFVVYHLLHLTAGTVHPQFVHGAPFQNLVVAFSDPIIVGVYLVAVSALCVHLYHGLWSALQTLGLGGGAFLRAQRGLTLSIVLFLWVGYLIVPTSVLLGWIAP